MIMLHKCDIDPYCDTTFILLNVESTELLRDFWTQNKVIIIIIIIYYVCIMFVYYLPPVFEKRREVLFWGPSPSPPSPPSKPTFCLISRLLLKLAF